MMCELVNTVIRSDFANCNSIANQLGATGIIILVVVFVSWGIIKLYSKFANHAKEESNGNN